MARSRVFLQGARDQTGWKGSRCTASWGVIAVVFCRGKFLDLVTEGVFLSWVLYKILPIPRVWLTCLVRR